MNSQNIASIVTRLPYWERLTNDERRTVEGTASIMEFEKGQLINSSDTDCMGMVPVLSGAIRVCLLSDEGREITLFRVPEGDSCVTTASCVIRHITFDTVVSADARSRLLVVPAYVFGRLAETNIYVRSYMFEKETDRFSQVVKVLQQLIFTPFDRRPAEHLIAAYDSGAGADLPVTQEELARDVNSAREVVARMLRRFTREGLVEVKRGHILLRNIEGLRAVAML